MPALLPTGVHVWERGWLSSNNVLLLTPSEAALIDSGYATHADQTLALLQRELHGRPLCWLLNTHLHSDHCGGNAAIQTQHPGVRTLIPPGSADAVLAWDEARLSYRATGQRCPRFAFDGLLPPGSAFVFGALTWEIHAAPAHDDGALPSAPVAAALATARQRLAHWQAHPAKHRQHALKVLLKFKLLEWQRQPIGGIHAWAREVPYLRHIYAQHHADQPFEAWLDDLIDALCSSGVARREDGDLVDTA